LHRGNWTFNLFYNWVATIHNEKPGFVISLFPIASIRIPAFSLL